MDQYIRQIDGTLNSILQTYVRKPTIIKGIVHLLLILYAARLAPNLPKAVLQLFTNAYFKLFIFALILWSAQFSPSTSILIAIGFMVTMNYINNQPLWEFLENVDPATAPIAPNKEAAIGATTAIIQEQIAAPPPVESVAQMKDTVVIQPTIVEGPDGSPAVLNPTVVVAPAVVTAPSGESIIVKPDITLVPTDASQSPIVMSAPPPAPAPAPAPTPAPAQAKEPHSEPAQCYPVRRYDMSKVNAFESVNYHTIS